MKDIIRKNPGRLDLKQDLVDVSRHFLKDFCSRKVRVLRLSVTSLM